MARRRIPRRKKAASFESWVAAPVQQPWSPKASPEAQLVAGIGNILVGYFFQKVAPGLLSGLRATTEAQIVTEDEIARVDDRQLGRSEVIREIATPKKN